MYTKSEFAFWRHFICVLTVLTFTFISPNSIADDGTFTKTVSVAGKNSLVEKYDVFTEDNKEYTLKLGEINGYKSLTFIKTQNSDYIRVYSSNMMKGDGRYSKPRSGKIEIKFDNDEKTYDLGGTSYYLRYTTTNISKTRQAELFEKLSSKNYMYVKVDVVGEKFVFKVDLQGSRKMLQVGTFL
ncbi:hypothetical protein RUK98_003587 [Vibrio cholerae]|nr:hypothetical protein [Vibrio cholerae]ELJ8717866.1 hypothetical protein [Vibrio cholerae]HAS3564986.1 hypothetical protein [Vibrio cholerae]HDZ3742444.1 hypothetical protein [Vibrio cholerae]HDZ3764163.1 hypothetical protein [Vibrio cholerae]